MLGPLRAHGNGLDNRLASHPMADGKPSRGRLYTCSPAELALTLGVADSRVETLDRLSPMAATLDVARVYAKTPKDNDALPSARYERIREIGRGGMGRVDELLDRALGRTVAQKSCIESDDGLAAILIAEAQICAQLEHPSIVPVYDIAFDEEGSPTYTMRVVRGRTLRDAMEDRIEGRRAALSFAQLLGVLRQVCLAVDYAHARGVVHRDLKPENIIVGDFGEVYVLDWGIAHVLEGSDIRHDPALLVRISSAGSPGYMAPEQATGERIEARTDVFALGVILYEILAGAQPFSDRNLAGVLARARVDIDLPPPSARSPQGPPPGVFDALVMACLSRDSERRPASARIIADAIDAFLDAERARGEREREARAYVAEGEAAREEHERLDSEARELSQESERILLELKPSEQVYRKKSAWLIAERAKRLSADAARALAHAEAAFTRAIGRVADQSDARRGLASLYWRQFLWAEEGSDTDRMAQYLDLARAYDDGELALELADEGTLVLRPTAPGAEMTLARYEPEGPLLLARTHQVLTESARLTLRSGSYLVTAKLSDTEFRYPLVIRRAQEHTLTLRMPTPDEIPEGMILVAGGPFFTPAETRSARLVERELPDFAIGRFPVTFREYVQFLDSLTPVEREERLPRLGANSPLVVQRSGTWKLADDCVEGEARKYVPADRELDLPVHGVSWFDALAYVRWLSAESEFAYRLPTELEWEKAMRGADGRPCPMGTKLDPSFAKLRESRPEASQPEPVGAFPLDESPYGVRDLAGGVGDWVSTGAHGEVLPIDLDESKVVEQQGMYRGSHWSSLVIAPRALQRLHHRVGWVGFRLALSLDSRGSSSLTRTPMRRPDPPKRRSERPR
jgi:serine/threonine protein kinase/formylglycine-generating enzyme required for sulfatase activity